MMKKRVIRAVSVLATVCFLFSALPAFVFAASDSDDTPVQSGTAAQEPSTGDEIPDYSEYLKQHEDAARPSQEIVIQAKDYTDQTASAELLDVDGKQVVSTSDEGYIEWTTDIPETGMYQIKLTYYTLEGKGSSIEREIYIDGMLPFSEAEFLSFFRIWEYASEEFTEDLNGNQLRPAQQEIHRFATVFLTDSNGYAQEPLEFYLTKGTHTIRLNAVREIMGIESLTLCRAEQEVSYDEYNSQNPAGEYGEEIPVIEAEWVFEKSGVEIIPYADRTNAYTSPQDPFTTKLNVMDGANDVGEFLTWSFEVKKAGRYKIIPRYKQNSKDGTFVTRSVKIDDKTPFDEAKNIRFLYTNSWKAQPLGDEEREYEFYLDAGPHTITFEVALGDFAPIVGAVNEALGQVNEIYRSLLMITGPVPDQYRDYEFKTIIPNTIANMKTQAEILQQQSDALVKITGAKGSDTAVIDKLIFQLETMYQNPDIIAKMLSDFQGSCSYLGEWVLVAKKQDLELDWIRIIPANEEYKEHHSFWTQVNHTLLSFFASFIVDYDTMGVLSDSPDNKQVTVWTVTGRDQVQIIQRLADSTLSAKGINAKIKLVGAGTLLPSVLSGRGPDVSFFNPCSDPINYAVRKAVVDLSTMDGFQDVIQSFNPESMVPYQFEGRTYALPETVYFPMMFYRKDIFNQLGLSVPETWEDFYALIPELQKKNMQIGFPGSLTGLQIFLYQSGISLYSDDLTKSTFSDDRLIDKFTDLMDLYTVYSFPVSFDAANRFRTGEMPLLITDYTLHNQLTVFAPEIRGQWEFAPLPGTVKEDGTIDRTSPINSVTTPPVTGAPATTPATGVMMLNGAKDREAAWEVIKWWMSDETQTDFCREMVTVLGAAGKHPTANVNVLSSLSWTTQEYKQLSAQFEHIKGTPEVPGGYYISRYYDFAFNETYNNGTLAYKALLRYDKTVNDEITRKRQEFGLAK